MKTFVLLGMHRSATSLVAKALSGELDMGIDWANNPIKVIAKGVTSRILISVRLNDQILNAAGGDWMKVPPEEAIQLQQDRFVMPHSRALLEESSKGRDLWGWKDPRTVLTIRL